MSDQFLCRACGMAHPLSMYRVFRETPTLRFYDFCVDCERLHGIKSLYEKHHAHVTPEVARAVLADECPEVARLDARNERKKVDVVREFARRELSTRSLVYYIKQFFPGYTPGWVHQDICRRLEQFVESVARGESPRLILNLPPRHGKTVIASDFLPSWTLGKHPDWEFISTSYNTTIPFEMSRNIRARLRDPAHQAIFPRARLDPDSQSVERWKLTEGGGYLAAGVGGPMTGMGAHILVIDDPFKNHEEAQSETIRTSVNNWYTSTARTRLAPGGGILLIQTRWHDADLTGQQLLNMQEAMANGIPDGEYDKWEVISYPAIAEAGEYLFPDGSIHRDPAEVPEGARLLRELGQALHPQRYPLKELRRLKNGMPPAQWNALYQQNPVPDEGDFFSKDDIRVAQFLPGRVDDYTYISAWDLAIGEKKTNDWTVGVVGALDAEGNLFVVDMVRGRFRTQQIVDAMISFIRRYPLFSIGIEDGQIAKTLKTLLEERLRRERILVPFDDTLKPLTDKLKRAAPFQSKTQLGQFYLVKQQWNDTVINELLRFPAGVHDDIVDALAWLVRMSQKAPLPQVRGGKETCRSSWKSRLRTLTAPDGARTFMTA